MTDRYTKVVLTLIAFGLIGIFFENLAPSAHAAAAGCGSQSGPCYVRTNEEMPLDVLVRKDAPR